MDREGIPCASGSLSSLFVGTYRHGPGSRARDRAWMGMSLAALAALGEMVAGALGGAAGEVRLGADQQLESQRVTARVQVLKLEAN